MRDIVRKDARDGLSHSCKASMNFIHRLWFEIVFIWKRGVYFSRGNYLASCPQPQKIRQHRGRFGRFDLHRDDWTDQSYRILLPDKGTKLATFAARCIENEILMHLRSLKKTRKDVSLHDPIGTDKEGNEITLIDILGSEVDDVVDAVQLKIEKSKIYRNLEILDDREKEVVVGRFGLELGGEERTQREIAKELGISRSYVSRIEKRALMKLYHEFYKAKR
jgi:RNA polymerase sporulation-specific sigma factor